MENEGFEQSTPIWFCGGSTSKDMLLWYCVDAVEDDVNMQKLATIETKKGNLDDIEPAQDREVVKLLFPHGKSGLRIQPNLMDYMVSRINCVSLGSSIYAIGAYEPKLIGYEESIWQNKELHYLDTADLLSGWRIHTLLSARARSQLAVMDGKIHIFGCNDPEDNSQAVFMDGEIFDPQTLETVMIPATRNDVRNGLQLLTALPEKKRIMFMTQGSLQFVYYDVENMEWVPEKSHEVLEQKIKFMRYSFFRSTYTVVGTTVYWFNNTFRIAAYDFATEKYYEAVHLDGCFGEHGFVSPHGSNPINLLHIKDKYFCLVWMDDSIHHRKIDSKDVFDKIIRVTKCKICLDRGMCVTLLSTQTYVVENFRSLAKAIFLAPT